MHRLKLMRFIELLERQQTGDESSLSRLAGLAVGSEDGLAFWHLHQEWLSAFSYAPGRLEALAPILALARRLGSGRLPDGPALFATRHWRALMKLRGPVESVAYRRCCACGHEQPVMATSGLYDAWALVCRDCGSVYFRAFSDGGPLPKCACGARFPSEPPTGCPACGQSLLEEPAAEISPYQYFAGHGFRRGPAA